MLNTIKGLINEKKAFMESAKLILESDELDNSLILDENEPKEDPLQKDASEEPKEPEQKKEPTAPAEPVNPENNLPEPIGAQTGEPVSDDSVDLMSVEIDLKTNTQTDVLPVPPANAGDAIGDDIMGQKVDSGFGSDENKPPIEDTAGLMSEPIDQPKEGSVPENNFTSDVMMESISIGDEPVGDDNTPPDAGQGSSVTDAVNAKVDEINEQPPEGNLEGNPEEVPTEPTESSTPQNKEEIMKRLSNLTKSIEDVKNMIIK